LASMLNVWVVEYKGIQTSGSIGLGWFERKGRR
jgi:hypothetical protein